MLTQQELNLQERHLALLERIARSLERLAGMREAERKEGRHDAEDR